ncbi:MAG: translation initiation factor IF-2 [Rhodobacteraceae bacterium]|nr:translation initiation factor IF-2 [Paracoccaceae bacterium]
MSDTTNNDGKKPLGLRGATVRQKFSHGRTKNVVVERKNKRVFTPKPAGSGGKPGGQKAAGSYLSDVEMARRKKALEAARAMETERAAKELAQSEAREGERVKRRAEKDAAVREVEEAKIRAERLAEEAKEKAEAEAAETKANKKSVSGAARPKLRTPTPANAADPAEAQVAGARAEAGRVAPNKNLKPAAKPADDRNKQTRNTKGGGNDRRRSGKLTINQALGGGGNRQRSMAAIKRRQARDKRKMMGGPIEHEKVYRDVQVPDAITVQELANRMTERVAEVVKALMNNGIMATQNQTIDHETAQLIVEEFGHKVVRVSDAAVEDILASESEADEVNLQTRPPVITIMGHVDHGKTSLLDAIRKTNVVKGEAGGITQHIGAYQIKLDSGEVMSFLDTPGHAAFTSMRSRGAQVTDIVVLVVAADDSVMPQTIEAINHAHAAEVPLIVAINKMDREGADATRVRTELLQHNVVVEAMSGDVLDVEVSAITGQGLDKLLENIALQAELLELKANPDRPAEGAVIEAKLDVGRGPVATVLVQKGTLKRGDIFVVGEQWGKVRALIDDQGNRIEEAGPSVPVEVLGLNGSPEAGDVLNVVPDEARAREIAEYRAHVAKDKKAAAGAGVSLDQLLANAKADQSVSELPIVLKADVQGSAEAIVQACEKIGNDEVRVRVLHSGVGAITESDVTLAEASGAPIIGFNVRANSQARNTANQKGVEIRYYSIIYDLVDDIKAAASGLLSPEVKETFIGYAKIKEVFKITGTGKIAGCEVTEGVARRSAGVRLLRDNVVIHEGKLKTLKRHKDEVKEVQSGQECGMAFENYEDIRADDVIEIFTTEELERSL